MAMQGGMPTEVIIQQTGPAQPGAYGQSAYGQ